VDCRKYFASHDYQVWSCAIIVYQQLHIAYLESDYNLGLQLLTIYAAYNNGHMLNNHYSTLYSGPVTIVPTVVMFQDQISHSQHKWHVMLLDYN